MSSSDNARALRIAMWIIAVLTVLLLAACTAQPVKDVANTEWMLDAIDGASVTEGAEITVSFAEDQISGSSGCNTFSGGYEIDGTTLSVSSLMPSTMMACEEDVMTLELAFLMSLQTSQSFDIQNGTLVITSADGTSLSFAAK